MVKILNEGGWFHAMQCSITLNTKVEPCPDFSGSFYGFDFRRYIFKIDLQQEEDGHFDVIGHVIACEDRDMYDKNAKSDKKKPLTLVDHEGIELQFTLWSKMCVQNAYNATKLFLFDATQPIVDEKFQDVEEYSSKLFAREDVEKSENTATRISTASKNSTKETFVGKNPQRNIAELLDVTQVIQKKEIREKDMIDLEADIPKRSASGKDVQCCSCHQNNAVMDRSAYQVVISMPRSDNNDQLRITEDHCFDLNDPNLFSLKVNHGGGFSYVYGPKRTRAPRHVYKGRNVDWFDDVDADGFSMIEVSSMLKELGYDNPNIKILYKKPTSNLDKGLEPLSKDIDVLELLSYVHKFKLIELFIKHFVDKCVLDKSVIDFDQEDNSVIDGLESSNAGLGTHKSKALENDNVGLGTNEGKGIENKNAGLGTNVGEGIENNNASLGTQESEGIDNDNVEELDPLIDDVYVDMEIFKKNTDPSVEWVGSTEPQPQVEKNDQFVYEECDLEDFDSHIDPDDDEAERKKALRKIIKCHKLVDVKRKDPDTTVKIDVERNYEPDSPTRKFRRINVCLGALKSGFKAGQRDLLGLDGCFMSGPFPIQILIPVGVDPNNDDLELFRNSNFTFVIDRQKGIIPALAETFSAAEHRYCLNHIYDNMKYSGEESYLRNYYGDVLLLPLCPTLAKSWKKSSKQIRINYKVISKSTGPLTPKATKIFEFIKKQDAQYIISWNRGILYQAAGQYRDQYVWKLSGIWQRMVWNLAYLKPSHIILTPSDYHTPIGRPPKKRKKSSAELYDRMVKDGKLSRAGKTVTCLKCGQKGHNSRPCIVNPSVPTVNVNPSTQQNMSHSARM
ncbi:transposase, MuDR [Tanacetum coccineum]